MKGDIVTGLCTLTFDKYNLTITNRVYQSYKKISTTECPKNTFMFLSKDVFEVNKGLTDCDFIFNLVSIVCTKYRLCKSFVVSILLYIHETWALVTDTERRIQAFENLRRLP